ncbi:MAG: hypothetical protein LQ349_003995 [Xanthoria aureola]|nr:MAG: hypothetical protein LQ349_003995 [Xanthoria aureola]
MENRAFLRSEHGYEEGWEGIKMLGQGAEGRAGLWEKSDGDGNIIDQICIKQIGEGGDPKLRKALEARVMQDLGKWPNNGSVRLRGYRRYPKIMAHRLYMEYCQHGDLRRLIASYRKKKQYFPEEFIWDVFHHLVNACKAMDKGPSRPKDPSHTTYVHRDIKPNNIFLAAAESYADGGIPIYPSTRMGDFGLCIPTGEQDIYHNPHELRDTGTWGYKAPEQKRDAETLIKMNEEELEKNGPNDGLLVEDYGIHDNTYDWPPLGTHTNIWAVGACMYELIVLTRVAWDFRLADDEDRALGKVQTHRVPEYSEPLTKLVRRCLRFEIDGRPTLEELEKVIDSRRSMFRARWSAGEPIPDQAVLYVDPDDIKNMEVGPFVTARHIPHNLDVERDTTL